MINYRLDGLGNKTGAVYPDGSTINYYYDNANRLKEIFNNGGTYSYQYDGVGRRTKLTMPNGAYANYSYDSSGRLTSLTHKTSSGAVIDSFDYTHDKVGNRLTKTEPEVKQTYSYDSIYRLLQAVPTKLNGNEQETKAEAFEL